MSVAYAFLKNLALSILPELVLRPLRGWHYARVLRSFTDADEPDLRVVRGLVRRGTTAVDLGANIGVYTKVLSDLVGPAGRVISVEPIPQTFAVLTRNIRTFGMTNVLSVNAAISDADAEVVMELRDYDTGGINIYQARVITTSDRTRVESKRQIRVRAAKLDTLVAGAAVVDFVKCDVEGHELACLAGAEAVLSAQSAAWLVEVWGDPDQPGTSATQIFQLFENHSYVPWWFDGHRLTERRAGDCSTNYFFLKPAHLARLRAKLPQLVDGVRVGV